MTRCNIGVLSPRTPDSNYADATRATGAARNAGADTSSARPPSSAESLGSSQSSQSSTKADKLTTTAAADQEKSPATGESDLETADPRGKWWAELALIGIFYAVYSAVRNQFGSASVSPKKAYDNAITIIDAEKAMGLYFEETVQGWFLGQHLFLKSWNIFYGTFHFAVTLGILLWLFLRHPTHHRLARNTLAATTLLALVGFSTYPLMPPRLLAVAGPFGGADFGGGQFNYIDTLANHGGLWSFDSGTMQAVSNQWAAMPSLHFGWSAWCLIIAWPKLRRPWTKVALGLYPLLTLFSIIVTANHYWLDAVGGAVVLAVGLAVGGAITNLLERRRTIKRASAS